MPDPNTPEPANAEADESFDQILSQYEQSHARKGPERGRQIEATVIAVTGESVFLDIGYKTEGMLPVSAFAEGVEAVKPGDKFPVSVIGRDAEGYYQLSRSRVERPTDWTSLEQAFAEQATIVGTVTAVVKGGLSVDVGVRAFMPASRSGTRDAAEMEKLVGQEIRCRITKLDVTDEDVVVDRRAVGEAEEKEVKERRYSELKEGDTVHGTVRSLTDYGAFVDVGGVDALLHVSDISWSRVGKPADVLAPGQQVEARVLKVDREKRRVSIGLKQLEPHPWEAVPSKYNIGDRVRGTVTRVLEFGAFVELKPGVEGLIHVSEMSWAKKMRKASDLVKPGDTVEAVILGINIGERRMSLGMKQALGDPWADAAQKFASGSVVEGTVTNLTNYGAFVQLTEGVEGLIHVGNMSAEKRIEHPREVLKVGQTVRAQVLEFDSVRRRISLGMKQLVPSGLDEYLVEHKPGDVVTGRIMEIAAGEARVELGEGIQGTCRISGTLPKKAESAGTGKADVMSLTAMLNARWKGSATAERSAPEEASTGQVRRFRISRIDQQAKQIELELA